MPELSRQIIPPGVADARARAFLAVLEQAQAEFDPKRLLVRRVHEVDAGVLPALIVEFSAQEFLVEGLREDIVRDVLANIWELKAKKGTDAGVLFGLSLLGMSARWTQWWEQSPRGEPNTYRCRVFMAEQLDWRVFLDRYDRPGMLFYLDPPYHGTEHVYGRGAFQRSDFAEMAERLARLKGRFILSINDHPEIRETFAAFPMEAVGTTYTIAKAGAVPAGELIIASD